MKRFLLAAVASATLSGCPMMASEPLPYLCHLAVENVKGSIDKIIDEDISKRNLLSYYDVYKNNIINIQYECPEDALEPSIMLGTESIMKALLEYKLRSQK